MSDNFQVKGNSVSKPRIVIFGVGGAGGNAINNMINSDLKGAEFVAANTDSQSLENSLASNKIQLGAIATKGLGAGSFPERGRDAAEENIEEIKKYLEGVNMVFISAGMGGGTGTGAAPVIAKLAREQNILTVGVVTKPFYFEGNHRMEVAEEGVEELKKHVDTLIVIPNQNLFRVSNEQTTFETAFKMADAVLHAGVRGITDLITIPGIVNLDFADIRTVMTKMGKAMMGTGEASGENRAIIACEEAISNPLLDDVSIKGAKGVLVNMTGGSDMTLFEADSAVTAIKREVDPRANIIFGTAFDENMNGSIRVSVVATGIESDNFIKDNNKSSDNKSHQNDIPKSAMQKNNFSDYDIIPKDDIDLDLANGLDSNVEDSLSDDEFRFENQDDNKELEFEDCADNINNEDLEGDLFNNQLDYESKINKFSNVSNVEYRDIVNSKDDNQDKNKLKEDKKSSSGFSLFRFMNNVRSKDQNQKKNNYNSVDDKNSNKLKEDNIISNQFQLNEQRESNATSHIANINDDLFFDSQVMSNDNNINSIQKNVDDDVTNVPAFFRKKK